MGITIDKKNYLVDYTSYGYYTDADGTIYPFEYNETIEAGERIAYSITWDDDQPENIKEIEDGILSEFVQED